VNARRGRSELAKLLFLPDLHYGYDNYSVPGPDGVPSRLAEWRECTSAIVDLAKEFQVDVVLPPGDSFTSGKHTMAALWDVYSFYRRLEDEAQTTVIGTFGNHDFIGDGRQGPVDVLAHLRKPEWGITTPQITEASGVQIAVLPWAKANGLIQDSEGSGDLAMRASAALVSVLRGLTAQIDPNRPSVLLGHWPVAGCVMSSGQILSGGEPAIPLGEIQGGPWLLGVMGHIHKVQEFDGSPKVIHTGALTRRDFGEERDQCGCCLFDTDSQELSWHELPARRFFTWRIDDEGVNELVARAKADGTVSAQSVPAAAEDAICRVIYRASEEQHRQIDQQALIHALQDAGAHVVAGVFPDVFRADRSRIDIPEGTNEPDAFSAWLNVQIDLSADLKSELPVVFADLYREVQEHGPDSTPAA
jgi:DNA repair exonuclease SbcCD nuclease subunit